MEIFLADLCVWCLNRSKKVDTDEKNTSKVIKEFVLWKWSTRHGKYKGCEYWSQKAFIQYQDGDDSNLKHEHVIPRNTVTELLIEKYTKQEVTAEIISTELSRLCLGCVLTEDEDNLIPSHLTSKMPKNWDKNDVWARYREAFQEDGITIFKVNWKANKNKPETSVELKMP
jgi:hypothetical protein